MPRPKKPVNYSEELSKIEARITRFEATIQELRAERQTLLKQQEQLEVSKLYSALKASGLSVDNVLTLVENEAAQSA